MGAYGVRYTNEILQNISVLISARLVLIVNLFIFLVSKQLRPVTYKPQGLELFKVSPMQR